MKLGITCLIPFYNEGQRLINTLAEVTQIKEIDNVICINDGSTDNSVELLRKRFPQIALVNLIKNTGKTEAVRLGLKNVETSLTLLLDADLNGLVADEIARGCRSVIKGPEIDIVIFQRINEPFLVRLLRFDVILTGVRILKTRNLISLLKRDVSGYDLEVAMNKYAMENQKKVSVLPMTAVNPRRIDKWGLKQSISTNTSMVKRFLKDPGLPVLIKQILFFAKN